MLLRSYSYAIRIRVAAVCIAAGSLKIASTSLIEAANADFDNLLHASELRHGEGSSRSIFYGDNTDSC
jgi:hypothetical protein